MTNEAKVNILESLDRMSEQTGEIITEYHWRELQGIRAALEEEWMVTNRNYEKEEKEFIIKKTDEKDQEAY